MYSSKILDDQNDILYELSPDQNRIFTLGDAVISEEDGELHIKVPVCSVDKTEDRNYRAYLLASNYVIPRFEGKFSLDMNALRSPLETKRYNLNVKESEYYSNKRLGEEVSYVVNRW
jgi:hypothetical protein